jgi:NAD+ diphosphatase
MKGDPLDRATHLRTDPAFLEEVFQRDDTLLVPVWRGKCCVVGRPARLRLPRLTEARALADAAAEVVFLGLWGEAPVLAVDLSPDAPPAEKGPLAGAAFLDPFVAGGQLPHDEMALYAYARGMVQWHRDARFAPSTGARTHAAEGGFARVTDDGEKVFPRNDPAVMMLVVDDAGDEERALVARQPRWPPGMFSCLAGFVEIGESLEECVIRETREEVGLEVTDVTYLESQPWPFPRSLMIGFSARAVTREVTLDPTELSDFKWVTRAEIAAPDGWFHPPPFSLANRLLRRWAGLVD